MANKTSMKFFTLSNCKLFHNNVLWGLVSTAICLTAGSAYALPKFYLPYPSGLQYQVTQGWNQGSHSDYYNRYAVDFGMTVGQSVAAVAPGKVIRSSIGLKDRVGYCDPAYANKAHYVVIDHGDIAVFS